jgi:adenosylcobinamide-GDP ribazoletransferase
MKPLLAAVRFLTILPIPGDWGTDEEDIARSVPWFPVIGLALGILAGVLVWGVRPFAPPMLVAVGIIVLLLSFSGCLHLDGLADTADGFLSSRSRARILEIMKDSRTGAMGVTGIVCVLLVKFASLASFGSRPDGDLWRAVLLMPLAGRCAIVVHMALVPSARPGGLGSIFYRKSPRWAAVWAAGFFAAVAYALLESRGLMVWAVCMAATLAWSAYVYRKIGGATGDTFGAVCEMIEAVPPFLLALGTVQK